MEFRKHIAKDGKIFLAGKNAENNEELIRQVGKEEVVLHTVAPGSPFVNIKGEAKKKDIREAAVFCARYSQDWRENNADIKVNWFKGKDIYKEKKMQKGTFGIKKSKTIKVKKRQIKKWL